jgi:hypothetical protein
MTTALVTLLKCFRSIIDYYWANVLSHNVKFTGLCDAQKFLKMVIRVCAKWLPGITGPFLTSGGRYPKTRERQIVQITFPYYSTNTSQALSTCLALS